MRTRLLLGIALVLTATGSSTAPAVGVPMTLCPAGASRSFLVTDVTEASDRVDIAAVTSVGTVQRLTHDGRSSQPSVSADGTAVAFVHSDEVGASQEDRELWVMQADGSERRPVGGVRGVNSVALSPDGRYIAVSQLVQQPDLVSRIVVLDATGREEFQLTPAAAQTWTDPIDRSPVWSPDGTRLAFVRSYLIGSVNELWVASWPEASLTRVHVEYSSVGDLAWGRSSHELLFTRWGQTGGPRLSDRLLTSLDVATGNMDTLATYAAGAGVRGDDVFLFRYGGPFERGVLWRAEPGRESQPVVALQIDPRSGPVFARCT